MRLINLILIIILSTLFIGCTKGISTVSVVALDLDYLNRVNNTLSYNGSIDITGSFLVNGSPLSVNSSGGGGIILNNFTYDVTAVYGEMYINDSIIASPVVSSVVWYNITTLLEGENNRVNYSNSQLIIEESGVYYLSHSESFSDGNMVDFEVTIGINGVEQHKCEAERKLGSSGDIGNSGSNCIINLTMGDVITLMYRNNDNTNDPTFADVNVAIHRLQYSIARAWELPNNTTINYNADNYIDSVYDSYEQYTVNTSINYNSTTGLIDQVVIQDSNIGEKIINYTYVDGLLTGVTY